MNLEALKSKCGTLAVLLFLLAVIQGLLFTIFIVKKAEDLGPTIAAGYVIVGLFATAMPVIVRIASTGNEFQWLWTMAQSLLIPWINPVISLVRKIPFDFDAFVGSATVLWYIGGVFSLVLALVVFPKTVKLHYKIWVPIVACSGLAFLYLLLWSEDWIDDVWSVVVWHLGLAYDVYANTTLYGKFKE